ncbi:hypothetical protein ACHQM5_018691 [Ranunculus cassubicifolius]
MKPSWRQSKRLRSGDSKFSANDLKTVELLISDFDSNSGSDNDSNSGSDNDSGYSRRRVYDSKKSKDVVETESKEAMEKLKAFKPLPTVEDQKEDFLEEGVPYQHECDECGVVDTLCRHYLYNERWKNYTIKRCGVCLSLGDHSTSECTMIKKEGAFCGNCAMLGDHFTKECPSPKIEFFK